MTRAQIAQIVMGNMPSHEGSRRQVVVNLNGIKVTYNREYGPKWGWTGWSADRVTVDGQPVEVDPAWVNLR
jgi:hypothetical protein